MAVLTKLKSQETRSRSAEGTRAAILSAAARIFANAGIEGARTDAIAAAAGVNKAMLFYYFKSKDQLYGAVIESYMQDFQKRAEEVLSAKVPATAALLGFLELHFDFISSHRDYPRLFQRMMLEDIKHGERLIRQCMAPTFAKLTELIHRGQRTGEFRKLDSHHAAISLIALNVFYFSMAPVVEIVTGIDPYSAKVVKKRKDEVFRFIRLALFTDPEASV